LEYSIIYLDAKYVKNLEEVREFNPLEIVRKVKARAALYEYLMKKN